VTEFALPCIHLIRDTLHRSGNLRYYICSHSRCCN